MDGVTHKRGVVELQFGIHGVRLVCAHLLSLLLELHHVFTKSYALHRLVLLMEVVTHERGFVELQFVVQRIRKFRFIF